MEQAKIVKVFLGKSRGKVGKIVQMFGGNPMVKAKSLLKLCTCLGESRMEKSPICVDCWEFAWQSWHNICLEFLRRAHSQCRARPRSACSFPWPWRARRTQHTRKKHTHTHRKTSKQQKSKKNKKAFKN